MIKVRVALMERKLYLYKKNLLWKSYRVSIGREISPTPIGSYRIVKKQKFKGHGCNNRYIEFYEDLGICGTSDEDRLGKAISTGSLIMSCKDLKEFYNIIRLGTELDIEY